MYNLKRLSSALVLAALAWGGMTTGATADTVLKSTYANGCTAKLMKYNRTTYDPELGNVTRTYHYGTISCPTLAKGKQARVHVVCRATFDRYSSWTIRGESWRSGNCGGTTVGTAVKLEFR